MIKKDNYESKKKEGEWSMIKEKKNIKWMEKWKWVKNNEVDKEREKEMNTEKRKAI